MTARGLSLLCVTFMLAAGCGTTAAQQAKGGKAARAAMPSAAHQDSAKGRRQRIAMMLEANMAYRGIIDSGAPKLDKAKFAGPFEYPGSFLAAGGTVYCASAEIVPPFAWPLHTVRTAVIRISRTGGKEVMSARIPVARAAHRSNAPAPTMVHSRSSNTCA